jgi:hypothetical protein
MAQRYLIVTGVGRSGTTIFRRSLQRHPGIHYRGLENNVLQDVLRTAQTNCTQPSRLAQLAVTRDRYLAAFRRLFDELLWPDTEAGDPRWWMAAANLEVGQLDFLREVFPQARCVALIRNGISVIASRRQFGAFASCSFEEHCRVWLRSAEVARCSGPSMPWLRVFRQEWMIELETLRRELAALWNWLDLPWDERPMELMLTRRFHSTPEPGEPPPRPAAYRRLDQSQRTAMEQQREARWTRWTQTERQTFELHCGHAMRALHYHIPWLDENLSS